MNLDLGKRNSAFTLVELLVVIAIIGIMVGASLPAIQASREAARRMQCQSNMVRLALAVHGYESTYRVLPAGSMNDVGPIRSEPKGYHHNWISVILPYLDQPNMYRAIRFDAGVYDRVNATPRSMPLALLNCPNNYIDGFAASSYAGIHHDLEAPIDTTNNGLLFLNSWLRVDRIPDGLSCGLLIGEKEISTADLGWMSGTRATLRNTGTPISQKSAIDIRYNYATNDVTDESTIPWTNEENEVDVDIAKIEINNVTLEPVTPLDVGGFVMLHGPGSHFAFGDGAVQFISHSVDQRTLQQMANRHDGQPLTVPE